MVLEALIFVNMHIYSEWVSIGTGIGIKKKNLRNYKIDPKIESEWVKREDENGSRWKINLTFF